MGSTKQLSHIEVVPGMSTSHLKNMKGRHTSLGTCRLNKQISEEAQVPLWQVVFPARDAA